MPYLFVAEKKGWRDEFNQPWEGTGDDYTDGLSPRMARLLLPFPESPLLHKNPEAREEREPSPERRRSPSPDPELRDRAYYLHRMTTRQVLLENMYTFDESTGTHSQLTTFWIRPRSNIADEFHSSPQFVRHQWTVDSAVPRPQWMTYENYPAGISSYSVHALESQVRKCSTYANKSANDNVANDLRAWAHAMVPRSLRAVNPDNSNIFWPAVTPSGRARTARSTRARAERYHHDIY
ncbi:hypothetical protein FB451DRAFT_1273444 [Mycena latifolia]|nr:hypothetical protein FB451DRAFT_1273444 [Mycena latifolia]